MFIEKKVTYGLALSGGGSRGLAHLGVLKAMQDAGIKPSIISGTSMGGILGAFITAGYPVEDIIEIALDNKSSKLFKVQRSVLGLLGHERVRKILSEYLPETFEELKTPLFISATNLSKGINQMFSKGPLIDALLASMAIPVVFKPVKIGGDVFVDGGLTNNLPAAEIRDKCKVLIGSHVNYLDEDDNVSNVKGIIERCFRIAIFNTVLKDKALCDVFIDPPELSAYKTLNFDNVQEIIDLGYLAASNVMKEKIDVLKKKSVLDWMIRLGS